MRIILIFLLPLSILASEASRTWTDSTGRYTRVGTFLTIKDQAAVISQSSSDTTLNLPLDKLSMQDLVYLLSRPSVMSGTVDNFAEQYVVDLSGAPIVVSDKIKKVRGRLAGRPSDTITYLKNPEGPVALQLTGAEADGLSKQDNWQLLEIPGTNFTGPKGISRPVHQIVQPIQEKDLLILLASHRSLLLPHMASTEVIPKSVPTPTAATQAPLSRKVVKRTLPEPAVAGDPDAPKGAHFLDGPNAVRRHTETSNSAVAHKRAHLEKQLTILAQNRDKFEDQIREIGKGGLTDKQRHVREQLKKRLSETEDKFREKKHELKVLNKD